MRWSMLPLTPFLSSQLSSVQCYEGCDHTCLPCTHLTRYLEVDLSLFTFFACALLPCFSFSMWIMSRSLKVKAQSMHINIDSAGIVHSSAVFTCIWQSYLYMLVQCSKELPGTIFCFMHSLHQVKSLPCPGGILDVSHWGSAPDSLCRTGGHIQSALGSSWHGGRWDTRVSSAEGGQTCTDSLTSWEMVGCRTR